jgi:hypothetical protein
MNLLTCVTTFFHGVFKDSLYEMTGYNTLFEVNR